MSGKHLTERVYVFDLKALDKKGMFGIRKACKSSSQELRDAKEKSKEAESSVGIL